MGWVRERIERDALLKTGSYGCWIKFRESLRQAADEFRHADMPWTASYQEVNGIGFIIRSESGTSEQTIEARLDTKASTITVVRVPSPATPTIFGFTIDVDGQVSLAIERKPVTVDLASKLVLEEFLFEDPMPSTLRTLRDRR
jgi:hypothetical protein